MVNEMEGLVRSNPSLWPLKRDDRIPVHQLTLSTYTNLDLTSYGYYYSNHNQDIKEINIP